MIPQIHIIPTGNSAIDQNLKYITTELTRLEKEIIKLQKKQVKDNDRLPRNKRRTDTPRTRY